MSGRSLFRFVNFLDTFGSRVPNEVTPKAKLPSANTLCSRMKTGSSSLCSSIFIPTTAILPLAAPINIHLSLSSRENQPRASSTCLSSAPPPAIWTLTFTVALLLSPPAALSFLCSLLSCLFSLCTSAPGRRFSLRSSPPAKPLAD